MLHLLLLALLAGAPADDWDILAAPLKPALVSPLPSVKCPPGMVCDGKKCWLIGPPKVQADKPTTALGSDPNKPPPPPKPTVVASEAPNWVNNDKPIPQFTEDELSVYDGTCVVEFFDKAAGPTFTHVLNELARNGIRVAQAAVVIDRTPARGPGICRSKIAEQYNLDRIPFVVIFHDRKALFGDPADNKLTPAKLRLGVAQANAADAPILQYFFSQTCPDCPAVTVILNELRQAGHKVVDLDIAQYQNYAAEAKIERTPTIRAMVPLSEREGREVGRVVGPTTREAILALLPQSVVQAPALPAPPVPAVPPVPKQAPCPPGCKKCPAPA